MNARLAERDATLRNRAAVESKRETDSGGMSSNAATSESVSAPAERSALMSQDVSGLIAMFWLRIQHLSIIWS